MIPVAGFYSVLEAHTLRTRLEAEGVLAFLQNEHTIATNWMWALALGGVRVCVVEDDAEKAADVVRACSAGVYRKDLEVEFATLDDLICPSCGSRLITSKRSVADLITLFVCVACLAVGFPVRPRAHECKTCGHTWSDNLLFSSWSAPASA